jgi:hypothetical protein
MTKRRQRKKPARVTSRASKPSWPRRDRLAFAGVIAALAAAIPAYVMMTGPSQSSARLSHEEPLGLQRNAFGAQALDALLIRYRHSDVDEFRLFGGRTCDTPSTADRLYGTSFSASQTVCVYADVGLRLHDTSRDRSIILHKRFLYPDGTVLCDENYRSATTASKTRASWVLGCSGRRLASGWPIGDYSVEISMDGVLLAAGQFNMR